MEKVIAKFIVISINGKEVKLEPVTSGSKENEQFFEFTPYGELSMGIVSEKTRDFFEPGTEYYIEFKKA